MNEKQRRRQHRKAARRSNDAWVDRDPGAYRQAHREQAAAVIGSGLQIPVGRHEPSMWMRRLAEVPPLSCCPHIEGDLVGPYSTRGFMTAWNRHLWCGQSVCGLPGLLLNPVADRTCDKCGAITSGDPEDLVSTVIVIGFVTLVAGLCASCVDREAPYRQRLTQLEIT